MKIPIVDVGDIGLSNKSEVIPQEEIQRVAREIYDAFHNVGFVYLVNHGVEPQLIADVHEAFGEFFSLPLEVKSRYKNDGPGENQGYTIPDQERLGVNSKREFRESFNISFLDGTFPKEVPKIQPSVVKLVAEMRALSERFLRVIAVALGKDETFFLSSHQNFCSRTNRSGMRVLMYPPLEESDVDEGVVRLGAHTDYGTFTFLMQDDTGGLEVRNADGDWIPATPIPGTILVNVADILQLWSGGVFKSTEHRVIIHNDRREEARNVRRAIAFFVGPNEDTLVTPLNGPAEAEPIVAGEYFLKRFRETYMY